MIAADATRAGPGTRRNETRATVPFSENLSEYLSRKPLGKLLGKQRRALRARAHHLKPVVSVGTAGMSDGVLAELGIALDQHGLVKIRIAADDREQRKKLIDDLCTGTNAELIQRIGHTAVLYRERPASANN